MQLNLYATFRLVSGVKHITVDLTDGSTVLQVMQAACKQVPVLYPHWFDSHSHLYAHVHAILCGEDVATLPLAWDTPLDADAVLDIFPPVAGG